jgi:hypothetical protein
MKTIKEGTQVKYIGETNDYTFKDDISLNSIGKVKNVFEANGNKTFQVEFENGNIAPIDLKDLEILD